MGYFVFNQAAMQREFHSWEGMTGAYIGRKSRDLADLAKASCGVETGNLKGHIKVDYGRTSTGGDLESHVGVTSGGGHKGYAWMHHEGTIPHFIFPNTAKVLRFYWERVGRVVYRSFVRHPGTVANKYLTDWLPVLFH